MEISYNILLRRIYIIQIPSIFQPVKIQKQERLQQNLLKSSGQKQVKKIKKIKIKFIDSPLNHIKKALQESNNNIEEAKIWLKKKGFKDAENKMSK